MATHRLRRDLDVTFRVSRMEYSLRLRADMRCRRIDGGSTAGKFWLDEFPADLFPPNSFVRHDAVHYGIVVEPEEVEEA